MHMSRDMTKPTKWVCAQRRLGSAWASTRISLGICPVWSESSLSAWRKLGSLATHWAHSEDSDQTGWILRLIWVFTVCTVTLLVLSCCGSYVWSESSLCAQRVAKDPSFLHANSKDSDQTGRMPRLIWVCAGRTLILLILSSRGSYVYCMNVGQKIPRTKDSRLVFTGWTKHPSQIWRGGQKISYWFSTWTKHPMFICQPGQKIPLCQMVSILNKNKHHYWSKVI